MWPWLLRVRISRRVERQIDLDPEDLLFGVTRALAMALYYKSSCWSGEFFSPNSSRRNSIPEFYFLWWNQEDFLCNTRWGKAWWFHTQHKEGHVWWQDIKGANKSLWEVLPDCERGLISGYSRWNIRLDVSNFNRHWWSGWPSLWAWQRKNVDALVYLKAIPRSSTRELRLWGHKVKDRLQEICLCFVSSRSDFKGQKKKSGFLVKIRRHTGGYMEIQESNRWEIICINCPLCKCPEGYVFLEKDPEEWALWCLTS